MAIRALLWPVRRSFWEYLDDVEDADVSCTGCERTEDGFIFPVIEAAEELCFDGRIDARAHGGELSVVIASPSLSRGAGAGAPVYLQHSPMAGVTVPLVRVLDYPEDDAALRRSGGMLRDLALTQEGSALFGHSYAPWARMDPLVLLSDLGSHSVWPDDA